MTLLLTLFAANGAALPPPAQPAPQQATSQSVIVVTGSRVATDPVASVGELRRGDGGAAVLMGSANLAGTLSAHGLIDEYRFAVNPVLLGVGLPWPLREVPAPSWTSPTPEFSARASSRCAASRGDSREPAISYPVTRLGSGPRRASSGLPSGLPSPVVTRFGRLSRR